MSDVLLIDFPEDSTKGLEDLGLEFKFHKTLWNSSLSTGGFLLPDMIKADIVIVNASYEDQHSAGLHAQDNQKVQKVLDDGGVVVVFVGDCKLFHLGNLVGVPPDMIVGPPETPPTSVQPVTQEGISKIFSVCGNMISSARALYLIPFGSQLSQPVFYYNLSAKGVEVVAVHTPQGLPVSVMQKVGNGIRLFLPYFTRFNPILFILLKVVLPAVKPELFEAKTEQWLSEDRYLFPCVRAIHSERDAELRRHDELLREIESRLSLAMEREQAPFNKLLTASGDELKSAVKCCLELFGFVVVDVDEYWKEKDPSRQKEEDLWIFEPGCEPEPAKSPFILAEVKSSKRGGASDDDCGTITRYVNRRMREFGNHQIKGLLVINHFYAFPPHHRKLAFSEKQAADATHASNILLTTYDLFRLARAVKEARQSPEGARTLIQSTVGALALPADIQ